MTKSQIFLQIVLARNHVLQNCYLSLCNSDENNKLSSLKKSKRRLHMPLIAFLVTNLDSSLLDNALLQVVNCFEKRLVSNLLDSNQELNDSEGET